MPDWFRRRARGSALRLALAALSLSPIAVSPAGASAQAAGGPTLNARDYPSIQGAIDGLPASGGTVLVGAGVFDVREKIRLPSNVELRGAGMQRTILVLADGVRDHLISNADLTKGNSNITIRDLQLQGNQDGQRILEPDGRLMRGKSDAWSFGVRFANVSDSRIENVEASDFTKDGFYLGYNRYNGTYRTRLLNCRARDNGRNGISLTHGSFNVIEGCEIHNNNRIERVGGIQLEPDEGLEVSHNLIVRNRVSGNYTGITLYTEEPSWRGGSTLVGNAVCFNTAERNSFVGLWDHFGQGNTFVGNTASGSENNFGPTSTTRSGAEFVGECDSPLAAR